MMKQMRKRSLIDAPIVRIAIGVSIFLASAGFFGLLSLNLAIKRGDKVTVPNIVGKSVVEALDALSERNLELKKEGARYSAVIPENYVLSQDPIPGTVVKEGTPILVVISLGSKIALVPNLVGKTVREARVELNRAGLEMGRFSKLHYQRGKDVVLGQWPLPDEQVDRKTPIDILVSLGPRPKEYRLPNLVGRPLEQASAALDSMGLVVGDITAKLDLSLPQGTILDQDPRPGSLVSEGSSISLVMSTLHAEGKQVERKFAALIYKVPYGFWSKSVRVEVSDPDGARTIYNEVDEPGAVIKLAFGFTGQGTARVYLDNHLKMERIFR